MSELIASVLETAIRPPSTGAARLAGITLAEYATTGSATDLDDLEMALRMVGLK